MRTTVGRLVRAELRLMTRDPLVLTFVFAFPIVTMLIIGGAFGTRPDPAFDGTNPSHWYVASYLTVVIAATGLVMLPVHLASYRERGVLRRFAAAGFPRWSFAIAQLVVGLLTTAVACALLLAVAAPVYGIPAVHDAWRVAVALPLGAVAFVSLGVLLGSVLPSARAAQAVGLLLFFPSFLLGAGRPAAARDGFGRQAGRGPAAAHPADQRGARAVARPRHRHRVADRGGGARGGGFGRRGPPHRAVTPALPRYGRPATGGRRIRSMSGDLEPAGLTESLAGGARWAAIVVFAAVTAAGAVWLNPTAPVAVAGAIVAVGAADPARARPAAGADLRRGRDGRDRDARARHVEQPRLVRGVPADRLVRAAPATAAKRLAYWAGTMLLFAAEWLWVEPDPGWGAWLAGVTLATAFSLLIRHDRDLLRQLRQAQAGLAERARAQERNRIARELHDVIGHTLTVSLLHVQSARLAVEHDPADAARALAEAERLGRECLAEVRTTVGMLREDDAADRTAPLPGAAACPHWSSSSGPRAPT